MRTQINQLIYNLWMAVFLLWFITAFLVEHFGTEYESYRHDVKGLIPFIW